MADDDLPLKRDGTKRKDRRGAMPGERRGGRKKGSKNAKTIATTLLAAGEVFQGRKQKLKTSKEVMQTAMNYWFGLASRHAESGSDPNINKFQEFLRRACHVAKDLAPYEHARLQATTIRQEELDLSLLSDKELEQYERIVAAAQSRRDQSGET